MENEYLSHHGILGMKWGVRRYQNKDGTLTSAGRKKASKMRAEYTNLLKILPERILDVIQRAPRVPNLQRRSRNQNP